MTTWRDLTHQQRSWVILNLTGPFNGHLGYNIWYWGYKPLELLDPFLRKRVRKWLAENTSDAPDIPMGCF